MYIFRFLVLLLLASICVPLAMHAQAVVGPIVKCPPQQSQPLWFKNPFLPRSHRNDCLTAPTSSASETLFLHRNFVGRSRAISL